MVTSAGAGYSRWKDLAVTRWREDTTCDNWGTFCYIRDVTTGVFWSNTHQPTLKRAETYEAIFSEGRTEFSRRDFDYLTHTEIVVSPEDDAELRRTRITNHCGAHRIIEITSYAEVVLAPPATDSAHPAFSKLFIKTEILYKRQAILCTRRPRAPEEPTPWMFHQLAAHNPVRGEVSYETDRLQFIGRGRTAADPHALHGNAALSGSAGTVLDPVAAIRCCIALEPGQTATVDLISGISETRDACVGLVGRYQNRECADRVIAAAPTCNQAILSRRHATPEDAQHYARLAGSVIYANPRLRAHPQILARNLRGQSSLWGYAISGDLPVVLLKIAEPANIALLSQLVQAHAYWRAHGLLVDLVILDEDHDDRRPPLHDQITKLIAAGSGADRLDQPGGIFVRAAAKIDDGDRILLETVARVVISDGDGSLAQQLERVSAAPTSVPPLRAARSHDPESPAAIEFSERDLIFRNGLGGFTPDGREYVITIVPGQMTPAPWVNILDAIAQSWSVLSGAGDPERSRMAMDALDRHPVRREDGLIQLLDLPFDKSAMNPGYIERACSPDVASAHEPTTRST